MARPLTTEDFVSHAMRLVIDGLRVENVHRTRAALRGLCERMMVEEWNRAIDRVAHRMAKSTFTVPTGLHGSSNLSGTDLDAAAFVRVTRKPQPAQELLRCEECGRPGCLGADRQGCPERLLERERGTG